MLTEGRFEMGIGTGRPGIEDEVRARGVPVVPRSERRAQVREVVTMLRALDGPDLRTPVAMAVRGPKAQAVAAEIADTVAFALMPGEDRAEMTRVVRDFRARSVRDVELAQQVAVIGDTVAPHLAIPSLDPAALRVVDALEVLPEDPVAAVEELQRRREEIGFSTSSSAPATPTCSPPSSRSWRGVRSRRSQHFAAVHDFLPRLGARPRTPEARWRR